MANQWGQKAEELEISNKVAGLGLKQVPHDQTAESEDSPDAVNPAETSLLMKIIRQGLVESKLDIEVQRKDPNSPLYSVKTFEALHLKPNLLKGVYDMGFNAPSKIQETALPTLLADPPQNMIAQSQSGTGKTAAFVLAMLSRVDHTKNYPQVLCLSPTYELAIQTGEVAAKMAKFCPEIKLKYAVRGEEVPRGTKITDHIIIGTPGKMLDWGVKFGMFDLSKIKVFVLDEADVMIDRQGHQDQCIRIHKCLPPTCQMMFFSATYVTAVMEFAEIIVPNPIIIRLLREEESLDNIKQYYVKCKNAEEKYIAICNIYGVITIGQAIIFCHTRKTASWLSEKMSKDGHSVAVLSGELTVEQRIAVLDRFRAGLEKVLITTNVLSRGIDVEQVTLVVNFDMPMDMNRKADCETYLHRIGRTGRFGKAGIAINLIDSPQAMDINADIEAHFGIEDEFRVKSDSEESSSDSTEPMEIPENKTEPEKAIDITPEPHEMSENPARNVIRTYTKKPLYNGIQSHNDKKYSSLNVCSEFLTFKKKRKPRKRFYSCKFTCPLCSKHFVSDYFLKRHILKHVYKKIECKLCNSNFKSKFYLYEHVKMVHILKHSEFSSCEICGRCFSNYKKLDRHRSSHMTKECHLCNKNFISQKHYDNHMQRHAYKLRLLKQRKAQTCSFCEKECSNDNELSVHVNKVHLQIKPYSCDMCERQFYTESNLNSHKKVHNLFSKESCEFCTKVLKCRRDLVVHVRKHIGVQPHGCPVCSKAFYSSGKVKMHMLVCHGGIYCCKLCKTIFKTKSGLKLHVNKAHNIV